MSDVRQRPAARAPPAGRHELLLAAFSASLTAPGIPAAALLPVDVMTSSGTGPAGIAVALTDDDAHTDSDTLTGDDAQPRAGTADQALPRAGAAGDARRGAGAAGDVAADEQFVPPSDEFCWTDQSDPATGRPAELAGLTEEEL